LIAEQAVRACSAVTGLDGGSAANGARVLTQLAAARR